MRPGRPAPCSSTCKPSRSPPATAGPSRPIPPAPDTAYVTRLSETGTSHGFQSYTYTLTSSELVNGSKCGSCSPAAARGDAGRIDLDQITLSLTSGGAVTKTVTMYDDGAHGDGAAGDGVYGAQIPAQAAGTAVSYYVTVTDKNGLVTNDPAAAPTASYSYTVQSSTAPVVTGISPSSGSIAGGTSVTISGSNLASATAVTFGSIAATIVSNTATQIVALSPAGTGRHRRRDGHDRQRHLGRRAGRRIQLSQR